MTEVARTRRSTLEPRRPHLEIVTESATRTPSAVTDRDSVDDNAVYEARVGRGAMLGAVIGFLVVSTAITGAGVSAGLGLGASAGLGGMIGVFGGTGFGFMMGAIVPLARHTESQPTAARHPQGAQHDIAAR